MGYHTHIDTTRWSLRIGRQKLVELSSGQSSEGVRVGETQGRFIFLCLSMSVCVCAYERVICRVLCACYVRVMFVSVFATIVEPRLSDFLNVC